MSYTQLYYHIVFRTKNSERTISQPNASELYRYIWGIIKNQQSRLYRINGVEDHIHLFTSIHPMIAVSDFVKTIKVSTSKWMKTNAAFPNFKGWGSGFGAFSCRHRDKEQVIQYIINQQEHHRKESYREEIIRLFREEGILFDERYI